jgi:hypothetical protein
MNRLVIEGGLALARIGLLMRCGHLRSIHSLLLKERLGEVTRQSGATVGQICHAMDIACVFYPKRVLCLQRAAATTLLLRRHGWQAEMVIGTQILPFRSHAWVELDGVVVNDKSYLREIYQQMERC